MTGALLESFRSPLRRGPPPRGTAPANQPHERRQYIPSVRTNHTRGAGVYLRRRPAPPVSFSPPLRPAPP
eukprot:574413-Prorocentrum_minimum.AAC.1